MYTGTLSKSQSDTFTEARARYVLGKIFDVFNGIIFRGFTTVSESEIIGWRDDIQYIMERDSLYHFEIQFGSNGQKWVVRYEVDKFGNISRDDDSGGIDFYNVPQSAKMHIVVSRDNGDQEVTDYLANRGWGSGGEFMAANASTNRSYSKDGYGVNQKLLGDF